MRRKADYKNEKIPHIIIGAVCGEFAKYVMAEMRLPATTEQMGAFGAQVIYILVFVGCIILFGVKVPWLLNSFTFLFFTVAGLAEPFQPILWMAISFFGGTGIIAICVLINIAADKYYRYVDKRP